MKIDQKDLAKAVSLVNEAVPGRPSHPILATIKLECRGDKLWLTGFDLSLSIEVAIPFDGVAIDPVCVPAKLFKDLVDKLPAGEVGIAIKDNRLVIKGKGTSKISYQGVEDYPKMEGIEAENSLVFNSEELMQSLKAVCFAVGDDETRQVLTGVHFAIETSTLELAATNGHRLAINVGSSSRVAVEEEWEANIPGKALLKLQKALGIFPADEVAIDLDRSLAVFSWEGCRISSRLLEGQYPNYNQLIPAKFSKTAECDRRELIEALERVSVIADMNKLGIIKFEFSDNETFISADVADCGDSREPLSGEWNGGDFKIAFQADYLLDWLKMCSAERVLLHMNSEKSPMVMAPVGGEGSKYLCMPVQIRSDVAVTA
jgi:DNA polymerase III subunit beta